MKKIAITLLACCLAGLASANEAQWLASLPQAMDQAKSENKMLLLDFTGSDWCGWCKKLDAETFSQGAFVDYAAKNLVLVQVDFPAHKPQAEELKEANKALATKFNVHGYPTLIVLQSNGDLLWKQVGYMTGGPAAMIAKLDELKLKVAGAPVVASSLPPGFTTNAPAPAHPPLKADGEPRLQGIFYSSTRPSVLMDGKICRPGDSIDGMRIIKIAPDKVTVEWKGQTKELKVD
jgi:protein disulfide-isomerase